jgi:hypothetical protein
MYGMPQGGQFAQGSGEFKSLGDFAGGLLVAQSLAALAEHPHRPPGPGVEPLRQGQ